MTYLHTYYVTKRSWTKVLSFLVRFFQKSEHDHAGFGLSYGDNLKPETVHEAVLSGVIASKFEEFIKRHSYVVAEFKIPITDEQYHAIVAVIDENTGKKYSISQLVGNAFAIILKRCFNYNVKKNVFGNGWKKLICAEYLGKVLTLVGADLPEEMNFETIDITHCLEMNKKIETAIRMK